jgi:hypothetical protein
METHELSASELERTLSSSGVSWGAVIGGAFVAAALSFIMIALGAGFGLEAISPWSHAVASGPTIGIMALIWLIVTQVIAFTMGGYLTGRLRTRWHLMHNDEVHFRDTANGFLSWAIAVVVAAVFLGTAATSMADAAGGVAAVGSGAEHGMSTGGTSYFVDRLFRTDRPVTPDNDSATRAEAGRILASSLRQTEESASDTNYLAQLVAARTGLNLSDATKRVSDTTADARQDADKLRKAAARLLLWTFLALIIGAFCASFAATVGGRQRDHVQHHFA